MHADRGLSLRRRTGKFGDEVQLQTINNVVVLEALPRFLHNQQLNTDRDLSQSLAGLKLSHIDACVASQPPAIEFAARTESS